MLNPNDLQRLVEIITEEVVTAQRRAASQPSQCSCHAVLYDCCPDRLRGVLDAGASRIGLHATGGAAGPVAGMIDHTLLKPDATQAGNREAVPRGGRIPLRDRVRESHLGGALCQAASRHGCRRLLGRRVPPGRHHADVKHYETRRVIFDGATEVDMVINIGALKSGDLQGGRAGHRRGGGPVPGGAGDQQGDHRGRAADRRAEGRGLQPGEGRRRGLRQDLDRLRLRRRDRGGRRADAPRRRRRDGRQGGGRRPRLRGTEGDGRGRRDARRRQRRRQDRPGVDGPEGDGAASAGS